MTAARLGQRGEVEELVGGDDDRAVDVETGQRARHRTGGQDDVRALGDHAGVGAVDDRDRAVGLQPSRARRRS